MDGDVGALDRTSYSKTAPTYASNVGRASSVTAARLLQLATDLAPISDSSSVVDVGTGTGAMSLTVASQNPLTRITAVDISASMLAKINVQEHLNITTHILDARALSQKLTKGNHSHVFSTFMLQSITTPLKAVQEIHALLAPRGSVGIAIWAQRNDALEIWGKGLQVYRSGLLATSPIRRSSRVENAEGTGASL